jgi:hypothetical protein
VLVAHNLLRVSVAYHPGPQPAQSGGLHSTVPGPGSSDPDWPRVDSRTQMGRLPDARKGSLDCYSDVSGHREQESHGSDEPNHQKRRPQSPVTGLRAKLLKHRFLLIWRHESMNDYRRRLAGAAEEPDEENERPDVVTRAAPLRGLRGRSRP